MIVKKDLIKAIHEGVRKAHRDFDSLSNGHWIADLDSGGTEGFLVSKIFLEINQDMEDDENLILELQFDHIERWSDALPTPGRRRQDMSKGNRVDISLFNKSGNPIHVIEVKRKWVEETCKRDIEKLKELLRRTSSRKEGSLKSGYLVVYHQRMNRPYLDEKMDEVEEYIRDLNIKEMNVKFYRKMWRAKRDRYGDGDWQDWQYGSHIIELSRKRGSKT